jgi:hypothetical protein
MRWLILLAVACGSSASESKPAPRPAPTWELPAGWKSEVIPFPLGFAPAIAHTGAEELRFPKGFFKPESGEYWSYAFVWRTTDAAQLDAAQLAAEMTLYFKGLITAVDENKAQVKDKDAIVATAVGGPRFEMTAHVFDAFGDGRAVDLTGWAERVGCGSGAIWVFALAPATTSIRAEVDRLATAAKQTCDRG